MYSFKEKKPLNYLFLSFDKFPPFRVDVSVLFGKELVKKKHQIEFVLQSEKDSSKAYIANWSGCTVHVGVMKNGLSLSSRIRKNLYGFLNDLRCIKLILRNEICGIIIKDKFFSATVVALFTRLVNKKCIFWLSYPYPEANIHKARTKLVNYSFFFLLRGLCFKNLLYRCLLPLSHYVFVQSEQMKRDVQTQGGDVAKVMAVPMCVQLEDFETDRIDANVVLGKYPNIIYLGALDRLRKIDFILRVFQLVLMKKPEAKLWLVGSSEKPEDLSFLHHEAEQLGVKDGVIFTGFLPRKKALAYVNKADVCLSPFYPTPVLNSTSPTKIIEYMAMGKPVVANEHPEQSLIIGESNAGICVPYREIDFSKAVLYLLSHPEEAARMGAKGRKYVEKYRTYPNMADQVDRQIRKIFST
jgi:glycosyltransferase involved in cell wall biosynthesis